MKNHNILLTSSINKLHFIPKFQQNNNNNNNTEKIQKIATLYVNINVCRFMITHFYYYVVYKTPDNDNDLFK